MRQANKTFRSRFHELRCHNANDLLNKRGNGCGRGTDGDPHAHTLAKYEVGNNYDTIVLCDNWFEDLIPFVEKVTRMDDPNTPYRRNNLLSLKTQGTSVEELQQCMRPTSSDPFIGSVLLHEMLHTPYRDRDDHAGLTFPPGRDVELSGNVYKGKAYDPAKAKRLARITLGGMDVAGVNVDNYVYYALWCFVKSRWGVNATEPPAGWKNPLFGQSDGYTSYRDGVTTLPDEDYKAEIDPSRIDESDASYFSGQVCTTDADCDGTCPPDYRFFCSDKGAGNTCTCLLGFRPPS